MTLGGSHFILFLMFNPMELPFHFPIDDPNGYILVFGKNMNY